MGGRSIVDLDRLALAYAQREIRRGPRADYTINELPYATSIQTGDITLIYRNGQTYQVPASAFGGGGTSTSDVPMPFTQVSIGSGAVNTEAADRFPLFATVTIQAVVIVCYAASVGALWNIVYGEGPESGVAATNATATNGAQMFATDQAFTGATPAIFTPPTTPYYPAPGSLSLRCVTPGSALISQFRCVMYGTIL